VAKRSLPSPYLPIRFLRSTARFEIWIGAGAETVTGGLDLARRAENRGNLGRSILLTHLFLQKSGGMAFGIDWIHIKIIIRHRELGE
jgi:hypothetical protein